MIRYAFMNQDLARFKLVEDDVLGGRSRTTRTVGQGEGESSTKKSSNLTSDHPCSKLFNRQLGQTLRINGAR
jgi:hypothetical protein